MFALLAVTSACGAGGQATQTDARPSSSPSDSLVVAVGEHGSIIASSDGGEHWRRCRLARPEVLCAVDFADARHGWAVGSGGLIFSTADGARTWTLQHSGFAYTDVSLTGVSCASATDVWAVGDVVLHTVDGGAHWRCLGTASGDAAHVLRDSSWSIAFAGGRDGWAGGRQVVRTDDGGATWRVAWAFAPDGLALNPLCVVCADREHVWAGGGIGTGRHGAVLGSSDGGAHWRCQLRFPWTCDDLFCTDAEHVWAIAGGRVYRSSDGGRSWRSFTLPRDAAPAAIAFSNARDGWLAAERPAKARDGIYVTHDAGATWRLQAKLGFYPVDLWALPE